MALFGRKDKDSQNEERTAVPVGEAITKRAQAALSKPAPQHSIATLEAALLKEFPVTDALDWDVMGLVCGEGGLPVTRVALALDPTVTAIREAASQGANVLITHHPAFLKAPERFSPGLSPADNQGALIWAAIQHHVALMNFHTALDVSPRAARILPGMLGLTFKGSVLEPIGSSKRKGFGQVCELPADNGQPLTLQQFAARTVAVFGKQPRVWGDAQKQVRSVATFTGSIGTGGRLAHAQGIDCVVCGEIKYHEALDLSQAGLGIIELGHDVSELPLVALLADTLVRVGISQDRIVVIDQSENWWYPEAIRV